MPQRDERTRGVILKILDMSALEAQALEFRQKTHPDCYEAKIYGGKTAVVRSKDVYSPNEVHPRAGSTDLYTGTGTLWTICTEGVGYPITEDNNFEVQFHGSYHVREESTMEDLLGRNVPGDIVPNKHTFDMMPFASVELTKDELLDNYPIVEEVDLADFVRTFGSRLEFNFWEFYRLLSK